MTADEVYGGDPALRVWLEDHSLSYVLAVKGIICWVSEVEIDQLAATAGCGPPSAPSRSSRVVRYYPGVSDDPEDNELYLNLVDRPEHENAAYLPAVM